MSDPIRDRVDHNLRHFTAAVERKERTMMEPVAWTHPNGRLWPAKDGPSSEEFKRWGWEPLVRLSDAEARIAEITKWRDEWKDMATELKGLVEEWQARAEAAEALLKEAGPAIEKAMAILRELEGKLPHALGMAVGDAIDQLRFPASAARAIHHKIGVKDE